jgi:septation ring formation regulator EzrA
VAQSVRQLKIETQVMSIIIIKLMMAWLDINQLSLNIKKTVHLTLSLTEAVYNYMNRFKKKKKNFEKKFASPKFSFHNPMQLFLL